MSDAEASAAPRRSQRERKQATQFSSFDSSQRGKRKRSEEPSDGEASNAERSEQEDDDSEPEPDVEEEDYTAPKSAKPKAKAADKPAAKPKKRAAPAARKPRGGKAQGITTSRRKPRKGAAEFDVEQLAKETKIMNDNPLFNAIMNPSAALQSTAEDFIESLSHSPAAAQAELINCVLRACGCNHTVDGDEAVDYDGVVDALDNITEALKQDDTPIYPLTSKLPAFRPFRASLSEFLSRLTSSAAELGQLYKTDLMTTLQAWVVAMSSSQLRSFRHTATVVALEVETALCEVAASVEKEAEVVSRQREGERKRKKGKGEPATAREKQLETKAAEVRERRTKLAEFLKEFVDGVFVHRYRDLDPNIRAECVRAMGLWFSKYPAHFLDGTYLRYVGWVLSDANTHVRLEAVRALSLAYAQTEYVGVGALQHFTERFKPRLVEMAMGDTELAVRVAVVQVLQAIDEHGLLEDEQREKLCLLVFDEEPKMRKAVSGFVRGVWQESVEERLVGKRPNAVDKKRADIKSLAMLLVQWGRALDKGKGPQDEDIDMDDDDDRSEDSKRTRKKEVVDLLGMESKGRTALAVEALWDDVEAVKDWETLLSVLLLDHSAPGEDASSQGGSSRRGKHAAPDGAVDEAWRLEEVEESILLEVLLASLRKTKADVVGSKKGEEEAAVSDITRALIKGLPRLFVKYQTDAGRMSDVLQLPQLMNLDMYLEMRMMTAYSNLWDDVAKQFMSHSAPVVLTGAVATIRHMMDATSLSNMNSTKILELEEELSTTLRDTIKGRDELDIATFSEDEITSLGATCARLATLAGTRDMTSWMEEDEGGKQSSAWDIIGALAERGKLGYREEGTMVDQALHLLTLYIIWKARGLTNAADPSPDEEQYKTKLKEARESLLEKLLEFTLGTQSNTSDGVKRAAFQNLINLHILFAPPQPELDAPALPTAALPLTLDDDSQYRCASFVQAEIERYAEELEELSPLTEDESEDGSDEDRSDAEEQPKAKKSKKSKGKQPARQEKKPLDTSHVLLEREYVFMGVITTFLRAIRAGAIHFRHSAVLLTHYGRLGASFDLCAKVIVDILREEGLYKNNGEEVATIAKHSLRESFQLFLDGVAPLEEHTVALAKLLSTSFLIRGAQLAVVRRLEGKYVVDIHTSSLSWICKRIGQYEAANNKKAKNKSVLFFKALTTMLGSIDARNSLTIKAHLEQAIAQAKIEVPATSKIWDAYRAYERRLTASREKGTGKVGRPKKAGKTLEAVTTDEEDMEAEEVEELIVPPAVGIVSARSKTKQKPGPKPKPKPRGRRKRADTDNDDDDDGNETEQPAPAPVTPKARPRRKTKKSPSPPQRSPSLSEPPTTPEPDEVPATDEEIPATPDPEEVLETPDRDEPATPAASSRKRGRSPHDDGEDEEEPEPESSPQPEPSQESSIGQLQVRRKRVRH